MSEHSGTPADDQDAAEVLDVKAKMRAALDRKQSNDRGVPSKGKKVKEPGPDTHGPQGGVHMHRRKAGGGGS